LSNVNFTGANLTVVSGLNEANLSGANFTAILYSSYADFPAEVDLTQWGAIFVGAGADLSGLDLSNVRLSGGRELSETNFRRANLSSAKLYDNDLRKANFSYANLEGANLSHADLTDANFSHANLEGANLSHANLYNANLKNANLSSAIFCKTIMPDGSIRTDKS
jgi:uncharacterized protein YjbI with pentapeptide repeats